MLHQNLRPFHRPTIKGSAPCDNRAPVRLRACCCCCFCCHCWRITCSFRCKVNANIVASRLSRAHPSLCFSGSQTTPTSHTCAVNSTYRFVVFVCRFVILVLSISDGCFSLNSRFKLCWNQHVVHIWFSSDSMNICINKMGEWASERERRRAPVESCQ